MKDQAETIRRTSTYILKKKRGKTLNFIIKPNQAHHGVKTLESVK